MQNIAVHIKNIAWHCVATFCIKNHMVCELFYNAFVKSTKFHFNQGHVLASRCSFNIPQNGICGLWCSQDEVLQDLQELLACYMDNTERAILSVSDVLCDVDGITHLNFTPPTLAQYLLCSFFFSSANLHSLQALATICSQVSTQDDLTQFL